MKVGDYVRTKSGSIFKIIGGNEDNWDLDISFGYLETFEEEWLELYRYNDNHSFFNDKNIIKSSPNILELLEEHDFITIEYYSLRYDERVTRIFEVDYKDEEFTTLKNAYCDFMLKNNEFNDSDKKLKPIIKSIVTKEQFESMEYKIGE